MLSVRRLSSCARRLRNCVRRSSRTVGMVLCRRRCMMRRQTGWCERPSRDRTRAPPHHRGRLSIAMNILLLHPVSIYHLPVL
jgi:hypothetical protein